MDLSAQPPKRTFRAGLPWTAALAVAACLLASPSILSCAEEAGEPKAAEEAKPAAAMPEGGEAMPASCVECHGKLVDVFKETKHGRSANSLAPAALQSCETCHGDLKAHLASQGEAKDIEKRYTRAGMSVKEKNESCLKCHSSGDRRFWESGKHHDKGLACVDCHSVHAGNHGLLVKKTQLETCSQCHANKMGQVTRNSHHPIKEGKVNCADCHNPHGSMDAANLKTASLNETCYKCHAEKRGPFLHEHRPVTEDCAICHLPHGAIHPKLLKAKPPFLCQSCHSVNRHPGTIYGINPTAVGKNTYERSNTRLFYRACLNCHQQVHGTNHPGGKYYLR